MHPYTLKSIPSTFLQTAKARGAQTAMRKKEFGLWHDISWDQYLQSVTHLACGLMAMGLEKGDCAAIIGDNCPEWVYANMGIQCCGAAATGVYATNAWPQVQYVLQASEAKFFFVENEEQLDKWLMFRDAVLHLKKVIVWDTEGLRTFKDPMVMTFSQLIEAGSAAFAKDPNMFEERIQKIKPDDVSMLIYTSGTTGPPKGAMLTHQNCIWMGHAITTDNPMDRNDEVMSFLPLCHIFEQLFTVLGHMVRGYIVNFIERPDTVVENMIEISPTVGHAVPRIWEKYYSAIQIRMSDATWFKRTVYGAALFVGKKRAGLQMAFKPVPLYVKWLYALAYFAVFRKLKKRMGFDRIRVAYSGAAPIAPDILLFFQSIGVNLIEGYGQTEGTGVTTISRIGQVKFGAVGKPLSGAEIKIADDGEIWMKSPGVFKGYFKNPQATAETIKDGWLLTGDIGEIDADGYLKITDRKKDIIVTAGGKNITPQYIENKIKASIYVNDAVVIGDRRKYITCLVMIDEDNMVKYAQDHKIQFSTYKDLTQAPEIRHLIQAEINTVNQSVSRVEQIKKFTILPKKLYEEDGEVTPTMKVKRQFVNEAFSDLIQSMY